MIRGRCIVCKKQRYRSRTANKTGSRKDKQEMDNDQGIESKGTTMRKVKNCAAL